MLRFINGGGENNSLISLNNKLKLNNFLEEIG